MLKDLSGLYKFEKGVKECVNGNTVVKARKNRKMKLKCQCLDGWRGKKCNVKIKNMNKYRIVMITHLIFNINKIFHSK